jgi:hypothetical protein
MAGMARNRMLDEVVADHADRQHGAFSLEQLDGLCDRRVAAARAKAGESEPDGCLRVTDPTRTLVDLGGLLDLDHLERAIESGLRRCQTSEPRLHHRARQLKRSGRSGPAQVLDALDRRPAGGRADSDGEVILLQVLREAGVADPVRQYRLGPWRFDLAWPDRRVAVELDRDPRRGRMIECRRQDDKRS